MHEDMPSPSAGYRWAAVALASMAAFLDGFDLQLLPVLVPIIAREWGLSPDQFGLPMSATFLGFGIGGMFIAPFADRFGRRPVFSFALFLSGIAVAMCGAANSIIFLCIVRAIAGIGIGTALVIALAMIAEAAPPNRRATMITVAMTMIAVGGICSGLLTSALLNRLDWRWFFVIGGAAPAALALVVMFIPDSKPSPAKARATRSPISQLFTPEFRRRTLLLWLLFLLASFLIYYLVSWWPTLFVRLGWSPAEAARATAVPLATGIVGGFIAAASLDRNRSRAILPILYGLSLCGILAFEFGSDQPALLLAAAALMGFSIGGAQFAVSAIVVLAYPSAIRVTGSGWASAVARIGTVTAPIAGGFALAAVAPQHMIALLAAPILMAIVVSLFLGQELANHGPAA